MVRRAARVDQNQRRMVQVLRRLGCTVEPLHAVGRGVPDLLVANLHGETLLVEVKRPAGPRGGMKDRGLTADQEKWHAAWKGRIEIVQTEADATRVATGKREW